MVIRVSSSSISCLLRLPRTINVFLPKPCDDTCISGVFRTLLQISTINWYNMYFSYGQLKFPRRVSIFRFIVEDWLNIILLFPVVLWLFIDWFAILEHQNMNTHSLDFISNVLMHKKDSNRTVCGLESFWIAFPVNHHFLLFPLIYFDKPLIHGSLSFVSIDQFVYFHFKPLNTNWNQKWITKVHVVANHSEAHFCIIDHFRFFSYFNL